ncbi:hypothetical protein SYNPS1DRAFT_27483 [Syncephalis pseudoplumigaleata]|uniref:Uncharacterized protein n=1 Tax=Syncephalis pseudoplumigaleata TaxID=1712513 RepID=A0A4P9Z4R5_9FUNG|nr:hypothetical protein SYNPS1DRAFT_27483 [Syncephalis pseudoplumigaleata]|eukprot:RKP26841.1 hypothetical protein SYNPS1DRAFT_27483 [Syncephalis pseudoplumigaleata]
MSMFMHVLQLFMVEYHMADPELPAPQVGRSGRSSVATFEDYALRALARLVARVPSPLAAHHVHRIRRFLRAGELSTSSSMEEVAEEDEEDGASAAHAANGSAHARCRAALRDFAREHAVGRLQVAIFWTLRALLAPALERLMLEDRLAYLRECGHAAWLVALFDPMASPRNLAIVCIK